jgi:Tfp pilus assembly protein FimT
MQKLLLQENRKTESGLTFLELIFVISIFGIMASIVLFRFDSFAKRVTLNNLAQDIALRIVEAQKSAISGILNQSAVTAGVKPTYGVYFESSPVPNTAVSGPQNTQFVYFIDLNGNKQYDAPVSGCPVGSECLSITAIATGEYISDICYTSINQSCTSSAGSSGATHISFTRPFPDASITIKDGGTIFPPSVTSNVFIELSSVADTTLHKTIAVTSLGQIRVYDGLASKYGTP